MEETGKANKPIIGTPNNVDVLMHCYYSAERHPRIHAPAVKEAIEWLLDHEAIKGTGELDIYGTTGLGEAWVRAITKTPIPKRAWIDEDGEVL